MSILSEALTAPPSTEISDVVVVVVNVSLEKGRGRGYLSVVDPSIGDLESIVVAVRGSISDLLSSLGPGCILLLRGLKKSPTIDEAASVDFQLSSYNLTATTAIKPVSEDTLRHVYRHENTDEIILLSERVKEKLLSQDSCHRRHLADIQFPGQLSTVHVKVVSYEAERALFRSRKRARFQEEACAVLIQDATRVMLLDCGKLCKHLKSACNSKEVVQITTLVSSHDESGEIVLRPTVDTRVLRAVEDGPTRAPSPSILPNETQCETSHDKTVVVFSSLKGIFIDELNEAIESTHFAHLPKFVEIITTAGPPAAYREARLTLECSRIVKADALILRTLCASLEAEHLRRDESIRNMVLRLLQAFIVEGTQIKWVLEGRVVKSLEIMRL